MIDVVETDTHQDTELSEGELHRLSPFHDLNLSQLQIAVLHLRNDADALITFSNESRKVNYTRARRGQLRLSS